MSLSDDYPLAAVARARQIVPARFLEERQVRAASLGSPREVILSEYYSG